MKKKCCHVRMLSPNKSCSKDNLDGVMDEHQYNPLMQSSAIKTVKDLSCDTYICYHWRATRQIHRVVSSSWATQRETKWQARGRTYAGVHVIAPGVTASFSLNFLNSLLLLHVLHVFSADTKQERHFKKTSVNW